MLAASEAAKAEAVKTFEQQQAETEARWERERAAEAKQLEEQAAETRRVVNASLAEIAALNTERKKIKQK